MYPKYTEIPPIIYNKAMLKKNINSKDAKGNLFIKAQIKLNATKTEPNIISDNPFFKWVSPIVIKYIENTMA